MCRLLGEDLRRPGEMVSIRDIGRGVRFLEVPSMSSTSLSTYHSDLASRRP